MVKAKLSDELSTDVIQSSLVQFEQANSLKNLSEQNVSQKIINVMKQPADTGSIDVDTFTRNKTSS
jgi:hypothetical protein